MRQYAKMFGMLKLPSFQVKKKLPPKIFLFSQIVILIVGLALLFGLYYILNIQYKISENLFEAGPVTSAPKSFTLDLDQPSDDSLVFQSSILISGKTGANMDLLISTDSSDEIIQSKNDGTFSYTLSLDEGVNNIKVVVFDKDGDSRSIDRTVYYSKEKL